MVTAKELMDNVSGALMCDESILNVRERELLANMLQRANGQLSSANSGGTTTIARVAGEIVAQRACELLAASITRRLLQPEALTSVVIAGSGARSQAFPPLPPSPSPPPPGPKLAASGWQVAPGVAPEDEDEEEKKETDLVPSQCVILEEFLTPAELNGLLRHTLEREAAFEVSEVVSPGASTGMIDYEHRQSRVLSDLGRYPELIVNRLQSRLPGILAGLGRERFSISHVEAQVTASNHGDFFHWHNDNAHPDTASREITFVYFFHREPRAFSGGELRIYDCRRERGRLAPTDNYRVVVPRQNQIALFASSLAHEITPVTCLSRTFADSRFTVNGWLHRKERRLSAAA